MFDAIGAALIVVGIVMLFLLGSRLPKRESPLKIVKPPPLPPREPPKLNVLNEVERKAITDEKRRRWLRPFGMFGRLVTYAVLFLVLYAYWPSDISHKPFASLTLSDVFGTVAALGFGSALVVAVFNPSGDDDIREAWGWFGVLIAALAGLAAFYFSSQS